jgi:hypothetical protein
VPDSDAPRVRDDRQSDREVIGGARPNFKDKVYLAVVVLAACGIDAFAQEAIKAK